MNSAAEVTRYLRRAFGDNTLYTPFSTRMKLGFDSNVPNMQEIVVGKKQEKQHWSIVGIYVPTLPTMVLILIRFV